MYQPTPEKRFGARRPTPESQGWRLMLTDLRRTLTLVWHANPHRTLIAIGLSLVVAFVPALSLWISKLLIDAVAQATLGTFEGGFIGLLTLLAFQVGLELFRSSLTTLQNANRELLGDALQNRITKEILEKAAGLELAQFENTETHDALTNAYREVGSRPLGVLTQLIGLAQAAITLSSVGVLLARLGWVVVPLILLAVVPSVWVSNKFGTANYRMMRRRAEDSRRQNYFGYLLTNLEFVHEIRLFGFERYLLEGWQRYYQKFRQQLVDLVYGRTWWQLGATLISTLLIAITTLSVLRRAALGQITVGDFSMFTLGISQMQQQFSNVLSGLSGIYQHLLYMRNLFEFLELPSRDFDKGQVWDEPIVHIIFDQVSFRYPLTDHNVLQDVSFTIEKGESLALAGHNGAGKSTLIKLLTCLYEPTQGRILCNGKDISAYSPTSVQKHMSVIFQDHGWYAMSAGQNIRLSDITHEQQERLDYASKTAGADGFIGTLEQGYDTQLGRMFGGEQLSGGQWQRLALARLYYRDADVLIFDEPTAALDAVAEFETVQAFQKSAEDKIAVVISHRFSTVRLAHKILVLEKGRLIEQGDHDSLMAAQGVYASMFTLQARGYYL